MTYDYIIVVGEKDQERFRRFRTGYDSDMIKSIDEFCDADNIWALGPSTNHDLWSSIQSNDRVFFSELGSTVSHCGIVQNKVTDQEQAIKIWGDSPRMREHKQLVLFSTVYNVRVNFHQLCRQGGINPSSKFTNIYVFKNKITEIVSGITEKSVAGVIMVSDDGTPNKKTEVVTRFIRDSKKNKQLKSMYHDECQICGYVIQVAPKLRYSEVHHIHPLKDGGDDDFGNMLVLCPTHHVEFDYKIIGIHEDQKTIIDMNGNAIGNVTIVKEHKINEKNIRFHLSGMNIL